MTNAEMKLKELVMLRARPTSTLTAESESELLELAVAQLNLPLWQAEGIIVSTAESASFEVESEIDRVALAMLAALAGSSRTISFVDFETVVIFYSEKLKSAPGVARSRVKKLVDKLDLQPRRSGFFWSARWFRTIR
ncbi:hypothetical protein [Aestuariivirga sp.]|jgi:hypothetical protein|uniref:hypothetical protein n=1 Tax=Aestuariivirga sp. TaxID=2650926 RepID=UPI003784BA46